MKCPGGVAAPTGAVTTLTRLMRIQDIYYHEFPVSAREQEEKIHGKWQQRV